jgi:hypothetical protein
VRYGWSRLQAFGIKDPTRPSQDREKQHEVESLIKQWIRAHGDQVVICGHTHRPEFPYPGEEPYFNTGSCVHPRCITCIELDQGMISLVKWWATVEQIGREEDDELKSDIGEDDTSEMVRDRGPVFVKREVIRGPKALSEFYPTTSERDPAAVPAD